VLGDVRVEREEQGLLLSKFAYSAPVVNPAAAAAISLTDAPWNPFAVKRAAAAASSRRRVSA
jgi:hypothetical protein